jgi:thioredoxin
MKKLLTLLVCFATLCGEAVTIVTKENATEILASPYLVLDIYASWCGPCKQFAPVFEEVAKEQTPKIRFAKANADGDSGMTEKFNVLTIPTIIFLKDGKEVAREVGYMNHKTLASKITIHFKDSAPKELYSELNLP